MPPRLRSIVVAALRTRKIEHGRKSAIFQDGKRKARPPVALIVARSRKSRTRNITAQDALPADLYDYARPPARRTGAAAIAATTFARSPSVSKSTRKNFASWDRKANCCARSSPLQAQKRRVLACPVLYRSGAPDTIRTCDLCLRSNLTCPARKNARVSNVSLSCCNCL